MLDDPELSDADFDKLMNELKRIEAENPKLITPDSPTQRVGGKPREGFVKAKHSSPMLSLDNAYSEEELRDWERRVHELSGRTDLEYMCELKLDGMSLALVYSDGSLGTRYHARRRQHWRRRDLECAHGAVDPTDSHERKAEESPASPPISKRAAKC